MILKYALYAIGGIVGLILALPLILGVILLYYKVKFWWWFRHVPDTKRMNECQMLAGVIWKTAKNVHEDDAEELDRLLREYRVEIKDVEDEEALAKKIYKMPNKKIVHAVKVVKYLFELKTRDS